MTVTVEQTPVNGPDAGVIDDARARQHRERKRGVAAVAGALAIVGVVIWLAGGGGSSPGRLDGSGHGRAPQVTFSNGKFVIAGQAIDVYTSVALDAPDAREMLFTSSGYRGASGTSYDPDSGARILSSGASSPVAPDLPGQLVVAVVAPQIAAVRAGRFGTFTAHHLPTLPYGEKAVVFYIPRARPAPLRLEARNPAQRRRAIEQYMRSRLRGRQIPALIPLTASGASAPVATIPWSFSLPSAYWHAPATPSADGRCAIRSSAANLTTSWGDVATAIKPDARATSGALLSCLITWYRWQGSALEAAILLNARAPGRPPAAIPGFTPLGHDDAVVAPAAPTPGAGGAVARRVANVWLIVRGGNGTIQRLQFLESLRITRLETAP